MLEYLCNIILILLATVGAAFLVVTALDWLLAKKPDGGKVPDDPSKLSDGYYGYQPKTDSKTPTQPPDVGTTTVSPEWPTWSSFPFSLADITRIWINGVEYEKESQIHGDGVFVAVKKDVPNKKKLVRKTDKPPAPPKPKKLRKI